MLLAIDIGNAVITIGGFEGQALRFKTRVAADRAKTEDEYAAGLLGVLLMHGVCREAVEGAVISSVVPPLTPVLKKAIGFLFDVQPLVVGPGVKTGIGIRCDDPASVGADLIAACVAAHTIYTSPALVVDMGLATNLSVMDEKGNFIGVSILPGVMMGLCALAGETAQLPYVSLEAPRSVIGKNTADCMKSGVIFGNASMIDGMIERICAETGRALPVILTGEYAPVILPHLSHAVTHDEDLVLKGLAVLYRKNRS